MSRILCDLLIVEQYVRKAGAYGNRPARHPSILFIALRLSLFIRPSTLGTVIVLDGLALRLKVCVYVGVGWSRLMLKMSGS